jgi:hypothetical protein
MTGFGRGLRRQDMKRLRLMCAAATILGFAAVACGGGNQQPAEQTTPAETAPAATVPASGPVEITLTSQPDPPRTGENTFEVMVMQGGQPVTDAEVSVEFFMAAMPQMKMPEMKNTVTLKHEGGGRYRGAANVMMAGSWDVTVMAMRGGQEIGSRKLTVTAK